MKVARVPVGKLCPAPESQQLGQVKYCPLPEDWESRAGRPLGNFAFFFFNLSNGESIEILVSPFFCLSPTHMVLSLVSYFSFLSLKKNPPQGGGVQNCHLNKVLFSWVERFLRARNHSKESLPTLPMEKAGGFPKYLLPNFLALWLDVFCFGIVGYWIHFAILLFSSPELPLP